MGDSALTQYGKGAPIANADGTVTPLERNQHLLSAAALKPEDIKLEVKRSGKPKLLGRGAFGEVHTFSLSLSPLLSRFFSAICIEMCMHACAECHPASQSCPLLPSTALSAANGK